MYCCPVCESPEVIEAYDGLLLGDHIRCLDCGHAGPPEAFQEDEESEKE